jgi:hypothetical protein
MGPKLEEAISGGFGRGLDKALGDADKKYKQFVSRTADEKITINVDINDVDLVAKLLRLGYVPNSPDRQRTGPGGA